MSDTSKLVQIVEAAQENDVPVSLVQKVIVRESTHRPGARNGPYYGLMQILPATLGRLLLEQRDSLPDVQLYRRRAGAHKERLAEAGMRRAEAHVLEGIALTRLDTGAPRMAREALDAAHELALGSGDDIMLTDIRVYQALATLLEGDPDGASSWKSNDLSGPRDLRRRPP